MKIFNLFILSFLLFTLKTSAQDFIIKSNDEVIRGTIKGTDYFSVYIRENDEKDVILLAKDVKNFFWNGNSYLSKGFAGRKDLDFRFVKVIEMGTVNLYSFGGGSLMPVTKEKSRGFKPSVSIGTGTGGYGGVGMGGGISIGGGGGRNAPEQPLASAVIRYFIEKPGTGPMQEIPIKAITEGDRKAEVKNILLQKMGDQANIKAKVETNTDLNSRDVIELVKEYNEIRIAKD